MEVRGGDAAAAADAGSGAAAADDDDDDAAAADHSVGKFKAQHVFEVGGKTYLCLV